jgi:acyl-coenzyme A thioesterase PaaI-like protein
MPLVHHELCFGCGRTNLFGLLLDVEHTAPNAVAGRCFIKQDHQGADPGRAHDGIIAAALTEAMALAAGMNARAQTLEVRHVAPTAVGTFVEIAAEADLTGAADAELTCAATATAIARAEGRVVASAGGTYASAAADKS